jgi:hypothetical protein
MPILSFSKMASLLLIASLVSFSLQVSFATQIDIPIDFQQTALPFDGLGKAMHVVLISAELCLTLPSITEKEKEEKNDKKLPMVAHESLPMHRSTQRRRRDITAALRLSRSIPRSHLGRPLHPKARSIAADSQG